MTNTARTLTGSTSTEGRVSGYVFKLIRELLGMTQQQLAENLAVGVATIQGWESGRRPLMAMPAGSFLALRSPLRHLGAVSPPLGVLTLALETDHMLGVALATPHHRAEPAGHPLASWVLSRLLTAMAAWAVSGKTPDELRPTGQRRSRHGPVPAGPALAVDERRHLREHLQAVAERTSLRTPGGLLPRRQAYYLLGFDTSPGTADWLSEMYRADRRAQPPARGWSAGWPLARSTASALTRVGDPEPMRRFIADQLGDDTGERSEPEPLGVLDRGTPAKNKLRMRSSAPCPFTRGMAGGRARHLLDRLHGNIGFTELNIHSLWALIRIRPPRAWPAYPALAQRAGR